MPSPLAEASTFMITSVLDLNVRTPGRVFTLEDQVITACNAEALTATMLLQCLHYYHKRTWEVDLESFCLNPTGVGYRQCLHVYTELVIHNVH